MKELEYYLKENELTAKDFIRLKVATGFRDRPIEQVEKALESNFFMSAQTAFSSSLLYAMMK